MRPGRRTDILGRRSMLIRVRRTACGRCGAAPRRTRRGGGDMKTSRTRLGGLARRRPEAASPELRVPRRSDRAGADGRPRHGGSGAGGEPAEERARERRAREGTAARRPAGEARRLDGRRDARGDGSTLRSSDGRDGLVRLLAESPRHGAGVVPERVAARRRRRGLPGRERPAEAAALRSHGREGPRALRVRDASEAEAPDRLPAARGAASQLRSGQVHAGRRGARDAEQRRARGRAHGREAPGDDQGLDDRRDPRHRRPGLRERRQHRLVPPPARPSGAGGRRAPGRRRPRGEPLRDREGQVAAATGRRPGDGRPRPGSAPVRAAVRLEVLRPRRPEPRLGARAVHARRRRARATGERRARNGDHAREASRHRRRNDRRRAAGCERSRLRGGREHGLVPLRPPRRRQPRHLPEGGAAGEGVRLRPPEGGLEAGVRHRRGAGATRRESRRTPSRRRPTRATRSSSARPAERSRDRSP